MALPHNHRCEMTDKVAWIVYSFGDAHASMSVHGVYDDKDLAFKAMQAIINESLRPIWSVVSMPFKLNSPMLITAAPAGVI